MRRLIGNPDAKPKAAKTKRGKAADKKAQRRREQRRAVLRRLGLRVATPALLAGTAIAVAVWAWQIGWFDRQIASARTTLLAASADAGLAVRDVLVEGRARTDADAVLAALGVTRGTPVLAMDPADARHKLQRLPWVESAFVERRLPDLIYVRLTERQPMAIWQLNGRLRVIDRDGDPIPSAEPGRFASLPLVVGEGAPEHAARLIAALRAEPGLARRVKGAVRVSERRWNIRMDNGVDVQLPEENLANAWSQLARLEKRHSLLQRDVRMIDLRLPDRLVVRMAPGAKPLESLTEPGQST